jgi:phosphoglycolate phosphatase-like HAD superfamily hydrolase
MDGSRVPTAGRTDRAIVTDMLAYHGIEGTNGALNRLVAAYLRHLARTLFERNGGALPGIPQLLELLDKRDDVALGLLTGNYREGARLKLQRYDLAHYFDFGGFGDRFFDRDDVAREALEEARSHCHDAVSLDRVWVIGDTPADVQCARAIGARAVAVGTGIVTKATLQAAQPDHFFDDFSTPDELLRLLDGIP